MNFLILFIIKVCNTKNWTPPVVTECDEMRDEAGHEKKSVDGDERENMDVGDKQQMDTSQNIEAGMMDMDVVDIPEEAGMDEEDFYGTIDDLELDEEVLMEANAKIVRRCKKKRKKKFDIGKTEFTRMKEKWLPSEVYLEYQRLLQKVALYAVHKVFLTIFKVFLMNF